MAVRGIEAPLVVIIGPTASGKSALAIDIAKHHNGEVICADSRTVFREMDIGTAKPSLEEQAGIPHWGLDLADPGERFTAAAWQSYARARIADIRERGRVPIIAGGTGLYVDGLIFDYQYPDEPDPRQRQQLEQMDVNDLYRYCIDNNTKLPENDKNKRHLIRSIVHSGQPDQRRSRLIDNTIVVGIATHTEQLRGRIAERTEHMFTDGVVEEARMLGKKYGWDSEAMTGNIYPLLREYTEGQSSLEDTKQAFRHRDWQLAKRQMTWFRRNPFILWGRPSDCEQYIDRHLAS